MPKKDWQIEEIVPVSVNAPHKASESTSEAQTGDQGKDEDGDQSTEPVNWVSGTHFDNDLHWLYELCNVDLKQRPAPSGAKRQG